MNYNRAADINKCLEKPMKLLNIILLTSTKWWAPASASKWRMGFNSAFEGVKNFSLQVFHSNIVLDSVYHRKRF
jgi:hypothetical protein